MTKKKALEELDKKIKKALEERKNGDDYEGYFMGLADFFGMFKGGVKHTIINNLATNSLITINRALGDRETPAYFEGYIQAINYIILITEKGN